MLTYNRKQYLDRSIKSILSQDFSDFEFIIVDNGSTDGSSTVYNTYAQNDSRITVIQKAKGNIGSGRNMVVKAARGAYITFIDDDDYAEIDLLSFLYNLIVEYNADISFCGSSKESSGVISPNCVFDYRGVYSPQEAVSYLLERKMVNAATPTKLFSKKILDIYPFEEDRNYEDIFITYKLFASAHKIAAHGLPKYCFVRHDTNNSRFTTNDKFWSPAQMEEYFEAYRERTEWLTMRFPAISNLIVYSEWSFLISMYNKIMSNNLQGFKTQKEYISKIINMSKKEFDQSPYCKPFEHEYLQRYFP
jgi:glycosyltransferase involved in cell wall biosynthesis